tara:strand:- start:334 stop:1599 length:1266 start_codon:yes stop_codon:yes gene_type:complete
MPNYLNILRQFQDRQRLENPQGYSSVNPYTSDAYIGTSAGDIYAQAQSEISQSEEASGIIPPDAYVTPTTEEKLLTGVKSLYTSKDLLKTLKKPLSTLDKSIFSKMAAKTAATTAAPVIGPQTLSASTAASSTAIPYSLPSASAPASMADKVMGFGSNMPAATTAPIAAIAYSLASDKNPYTYGTGEAIGTGIGDFFAARTAMTLMPKLAAVAPWLPIAATALGFLFRKRRAKKKTQEYQDTIQAPETSLYAEKMAEERRQRDAEWSARHGKGSDIGDTMYGGFLPETAAKGMKYSYNMGGTVRQDVMAEFTGNELVVNNQNVVEQGLKEGNYAKAAAPIRNAMRGGYITPGPETHANNPMPVTSDGTIYAGGGPLSFKVKSGAGIYDHATDQFKSTMSDKKIAEIAQKNINKWKSNNMYS